MQVEKVVNGLLQYRIKYECLSLFNYDWSMRKTLRELEINFSRTLICIQWAIFFQTALEVHINFCVLMTPAIMTF